MGLLLFLFWSSICVLSFHFNKDLFSPDKFYLLSLGVFFSDIFFSSYDVEIIFIYLILLTSTMMIIILYRRPLYRLRFLYKTKFYSSSLFEINRDNGLHMHIKYYFFWIISIPALLSQIWIIYIFGGIEEYINSIGKRVITFQGLGPLIILIKTFSVINLVYFSYIINHMKSNKNNFISYGLHFIFFICLALLSGSRGSLFVNIIMMLVLYNFSINNIRLKSVILIGSLLLVLASVYGVMRENISYKTDWIIFYSSSDELSIKDYFKTSWTHYGLTPISLVLNNDIVELYYGLTYLTLFTNIVPRSIWAEKWDTGGVVLTKEYTENAWGGYSNVSTGILTEAILNFGLAFGILIGIVQFTVILFFLMKYYLKIFRKNDTNPHQKFINILYYAYITWGCMSLIIGEFTNILLNLFLQLSTVWIVYKCMLVKLWRR